MVSLGKHGADAMCASHTSLESYCPHGEWDDERETERWAAHNTLAADPLRCNSVCERV